MYTPPSFAVTDVNRLHDHIEQNSFATLVSNGEEAPAATHMPLLLNRNHSPNGQLVGHMARANPQWKKSKDQPWLAIFHGPHAYVSPAWYDDQNVVPTWNYSAVHAAGTMRLVTDEAESADIVQQYVERYEADMTAPWSLDAPDAEFVEQLLSAIVCFTIDIDRLEGKWKLSQNHSEQRRGNVIKELRRRSWPGDSEIASLMEEQS